MASEKSRRTRMSGAQRREQLITVGRRVFAERGFEGATVEEIAAAAKVSKPVVYEHFGGKEGLYAVIVDREVRTLLESIRAALTRRTTMRGLVQAGTLAMLDYVATTPDGFAILARDTAPGTTGTSLTTILGDVASRVEDLLVAAFKKHKYDPKLARMYSQMLVGMVAYTAQWWLGEKQPKQDEVAAQLVNLAWNGLSHLEHDPGLLPPENDNLTAR
ncbi:TetR/AcrR family transcriptional regulator [Enemella sp. A6]|uniref:TetR/AcrR family transcriptional regulator n=1 Tax=Enemella sp. A6 TaxID=3440152 RepID=UPI003EB6C1A8